MIRAFVVAVVALSGFGAAPHVSASPEQYAVVAVGDSILDFMDREMLPAEWHVDAQGGRNPYDAPPFTTDGSIPTSTFEAVAANVPLVAPGGVFIFQDVAAITVDDAGWVDLVSGVVEQLPDDRCLVVVTGFYPDVDGGNMAVVVDQNTVLRDLADAQPCHRIVDWAGAVASDPEVVGLDGVHPSVEGNEWIATALLESA